MLSVVANGVSQKSEARRSSNVSHCPSVPCTTFQYDDSFVNFMMVRMGAGCHHHLSYTKCTLPAKDSSSLFSVVYELVRFKVMAMAMMMVCRSVVG